MPQLLGKEIGPIGYGLMGLTWPAGTKPKEQSFEAMRASLEAGCNFWNGGEFYGTPESNSLTLLEEYFTKYPEDANKVVLSIKGAIGPGLTPDGSPEGVKRSVDNCLKLLNGKKKIDIFECARVDSRVPVETTMKALEEYVKAGKIGGIALSEASANTIRKAASVTKIVAVETELSLWSTDIFTNGIAKACAEHDIPVVAYSPIGRGMLSGQIRKPEDIPEGDFRRMVPRFQGENFDTNIKLVKELQKIAKKKNCTPAQLAISWVKQLSKKDGNPEIIPIPGSSTAERVLENSKDVSLSSQELAEIDQILKTFEVKGTRYAAAQMEHVEG